MDTRMVGSSDLERYLRNSKKVDIRSPQMRFIA